MTDVDVTCYINDTARQYKPSNTLNVSMAEVVKHCVYTWLNQIKKKFQNFIFSSNKQVKYYILFTYIKFVK